MQGWRGWRQRGIELEEKNCKKIKAYMKSV